MRTGGRTHLPRVRHCRHCTRTDDHRCTVYVARWENRPEGGGITFEIEANRFLHRMVRFVVGTMVDEATGGRERGTVARLLTAPDNAESSRPAPPHGLVLESVRYPNHLYAPMLA